MNRPEDGFTVIELVISMLILLVITIPLVASFVTGIQVSVGSQQDVTNSADVQLVGYYFDVDVSSAELVSPTSPLCGGAGTLLELRWTDGGTTRIAYRTVADTERQVDLGITTPIYRMERVKCTSIGSQVTVLARTLVDGVTALCDMTPCADSSKPRLVTLELTERSTQQSDIDAPTTFTFGVSATRKVTP